MEPFRVVVRIADLPQEERRRALRDAMRLLLASRMSADGKEKTESGNREDIVSQENAVRASANASRPE